MFHKEGFNSILIAAIFTGISIILIENYTTTLWANKTLTAIVLVVLISVLQFFRNPKRNTILTENAIMAPVDGKIVGIEEVFENEYFKEKRLQVSIFISPINVHVTRYPISGKIVYSTYHPGKHLLAWHPKASEENERTTIVIKNDTIGAILYRNVAGALARRIVNYAKKGETIRQGTDAGFIKFGSRVDLYLPLDSKLSVKINDTVTGGEQIIATL